MLKNRLLVVLEHFIEYRIPIHGNQQPPLASPVFDFDVMMFFPLEFHVRPDVLGFSSRAGTMLAQTVVDIEFKRPLWSQPDCKCFVPVLKIELRSQFNSLPQLHESIAVCWTGYQYYQVPPIPQQQTQDGDRFVKVLKNRDALTLSFGAMIGWSWVLMTGLWVTTAGSLGTLLAFAVGGLAISLIGLTYSELVAAMPKAGGEHVYTHRGLRDNAFHGRCELR